jgi:hypothetical protein
MLNLQQVWKVAPNFHFDVTLETKAYNNNTTTYMKLTNCYFIEITFIIEQIKFQHKLWNFPSTSMAEVKQIEESWFGT